MSPPDFNQLNQSVEELSVDASSDWSSMEAVAQELAGLLYDSFRDSDGNRQASLVRVFKTCSERELTPVFKNSTPSLEILAARHLVLLGTRGEISAWDSRHNSRSHQIIPLASADAVEKIPMIASLVKMLGLEISDVVAPNTDLHLTGFYPLNVFYVENAHGSPYIPAQDNFVEPFNIQTVVGFGGLLTLGDLFVAIMFFKVPVPRQVAENFKKTGQSVYELLRPLHINGRIFEPTISIESAG